MNTVSRMLRMLAKSAVKSASRASKVASAAAAAAPWSMAFGEHTAALVRDSQRQRASVLELERDVGADELRCRGHVRERERALDAMQARNRQSRHCHALVAADAVRNRCEPAVAAAQRADTGVLFDELHAELLMIGRHCSSAAFILARRFVKLASNLHSIQRALEGPTTKQQCSRRARRGRLWRRPNAPADRPPRRARRRHWTARHPRADVHPRRARRRPAALVRRKRRAE